MSVAAAGPQVAGALPVGVDGLHDILAAGCAATHMHLVESQSGTGGITLDLPLPRNGNGRGLCIILFVIGNRILAAAASPLPGNRTDAKR